MGSYYSKQVQERFNHPDLQFVSIEKSLKQKFKQEFGLTSVDSKCSPCPYLSDGLIPKGIGHFPELILVGMGKNGEKSYELKYGRYENNDEVVKVKIITANDTDKSHKCLCGYYDLKMNVVVPAMYDEVSMFDNQGRCFGIKDGHTYLLSCNKRPMELPYHGVDTVKGLLVYEKDGKKGMINTDCEILSEPIYEDITISTPWYSEPLDKYIDWEMILTGYIEAKTPHGNYLYNDSGKQITVKPYYTIWYHRNSDLLYGDLNYIYRHCLFELEHVKGETIKYGIIDIINKEIILDCEYDEICIRINDVMFIKKDDRVAAFNPYTKRFIFGFEEGWEDVEVDRHCFTEKYFNDNGRDSSIFLFPAKRNGKWGYMNIYGVEKIKCSYDRTFGFREEDDGMLALVETKSHNDRKLYYIDMKGNFVKDYNPYTDWIERIRFFVEGS